MLQLYVQVEGYVRTVHLIAAFVGTGEVLLYLHSQSPVFLAVFELVQFGVFFLQGLCREEGT